MSELDDRDLIRASQNEPPEQDAPAPQRSAPILWIAVGGLLLGGGLAWWWTARDPGGPAPMAAVAATEESVAPPANDAPPPLPPLGQMDIFLRSLLGPLSSSPEIARWLATGDLIRQMARAIDLVSRGASPAADLPVLTPRDNFDVAGRRGSYTIDPASYRRYDRLAAAIEGLDAEGVARAYRTIQPRLDEAYRALGRTDAGVDTAVHAAIDMLLETPRVEDPIRVVPGRGATYAFADPALESLPPVRKQLLRMGPNNVARVQAKLREIKAAIAASASR